LKKKKGDVSQYLATLIGVIVILVISLASINYIEASMKFITGNQIARKYMLKIESEGYLSQVNITRLESELTSKNLQNIDLTGTTLTTVGNGGDVFLMISYDQNIRHLTIDGFSFSFKYRAQRVVITKSSTSKVLL
jgi:hypothetical protein